MKHGNNFGIGQYGWAADNIHVTLVKFPKSSFLWLICPPDGLNLVTLEWFWNLRIQSDDPAKWNCQIITQAYLPTPPVHKTVSKAIRFLPVLAGQGFPEFNAGGFQWFKAKSLECFANFVDNKLPFHHLLGKKIPGAFVNSGFYALTQLDALAVS